MTFQQCKQCYFPRPGVNEMLDGFIHRLQYAADKFDDEEWSKKILDFLRDLNPVLGDSENRETQIARILSHL